MPFCSLKREDINKEDMANKHTRGTEVISNKLATGSKGMISSIMLRVTGGSRDTKLSSLTPTLSRQRLTTRHNMPTEHRQRNLRQRWIGSLQPLPMVKSTTTMKERVKQHGRNRRGCLKRFDEIFVVLSLFFSV